jgi:hypothetical protein
MMDASLLTEVRAAGLKVETRGENLWVEPIDRLTPDLRARLVEHKPEIIAYLRQHSEPEDQLLRNPTISEEKKEEKTEDQLLRKTSISETFSNPLDLREVLAFEVRLLGELPLPPVLVVEVSGFDSTVVLDLRKRPNTWRRQSGPRHPTFELSEIEALVEACEQERCWPRDFLSWCQRKQREPHWRLTREIALEGADGLIRRPPKPKNWTVGRLLDALDAKLRLIKIVAQGAKTAGHGPYAEATR